MPRVGPRAGQRLLAVNRYYWPDHSATGQLLTDLAERMARQDWRVEVVTSRMRYEDSSAMLPVRETREGVAIRRLGTTRFGRRILVGRAIDCLSFHAMALLYLLCRVRAGDVVLAKSDPPLIGVVAWLVARLRGATLIHWCQDIFPEIASTLGVRTAGGAPGAVLRAARTASLKGATVNIVPDETMAAHLHRCGVPAGKVMVIPNWPDAIVRPVAAEANALRRAWGFGERFVIGYSGNLGRAHDTEAILRLGVQLQGQGDIALLLIGGGAGSASLRQAADRQGLGNLHFKPYRPREELAFSLSVPDLHIVSLLPACDGLAFPSKLFGVMAAGRPVLVIGSEDGAAARIVTRAGCGIVLPAERPDAWPELILALKADPERLARMRQAGRDCFLARFAGEHALATWSRVLDAVLAPDREKAGRELRAHAAAADGAVLVGRELR